MPAFFETRKTKELEARFAAALQVRFISPWQRSIKAWLRRVKRMPRLGELTRVLKTQVAPDRAVLEEILSEFHLEAGDIGGQHAINTIRATLRQQGDTWADRVQVSEAIRRVFEALGETLAERLAKGVGTDAPSGAFVFHLRDKRLLNQLKTRGTKITGEVTKTMLADLRGVLVQKVYKEGAGPAAVAKDLDQIFPVTYAHRGRTIARTETLFAQGAVTDKTYRENGVEEKEWLAFLDSRTRDDHAAAHGQVQPIKDPFNVGGASMMYPGDPSGPPEQVINCRCDMLPVIGTGTSLPQFPWLGVATAALGALAVSATGEQEAAT